MGTDVERFLGASTALANRNNLPAPQIQAKVSGSGNVDHHGVVTGGARLRVSGSSHVNAVRVDGDVDAKVSGSGSIYANGRSYQPCW